MAERDKVEPFWARPARLKRRSRPPSIAVPPREPEPAPEPPAPAPPPGVPQEPSFAISSQMRRNTIAAVIAGGLARAEPERAETAPSLARGPAGATPTPDDETPPPAAETSPPAAGGWVALSDAEAARHPLFGVRGWLVAIAVLVSVGLFRALVELIDFWATTDHGGHAAWIMAILRSGMAVWAALILGLLLGRSRAFPANFAAYGMLNVIYLVLFGLAFAHVTHGTVFAGVGVGIAVTLAAVAYVLRSRRVNVTFLKRVRAGQSAPAAPGPAAAPALPG